MQSSAQLGSAVRTLRSFLQGVVLTMKALGVDRVANFPFPTLPEAAALAAAERCLVALSALDGGSGQLTALGRAMAAYPISPRHARMLMEVALQDRAEAAAAAAAAAAGQAGGGGGGGRTRRVLPYAIALAAVLSVDSPFVHVDSAEMGGKDGKGGKDGEDGEGGEDDEEEAEEGGEEAVARREERRRQREAVKQKRAAARAAHAQFRVADSDGLRWVVEVG